MLEFRDLSGVFIESRYDARILGKQLLFSEICSQLCLYIFAMTGFTSPSRLNQRHYNPLTFHWGGVFHSLQNLFSKRHFALDTYGEQVFILRSSKPSRIPGTSFSALVLPYWKMLSSETHTFKVVWRSLNT